MTMDGIFLSGVKKELSNSLISGRILKIYQPTKSEIVFHVRAQGKNQKLLISANPSTAACYITNQEFEYPSEPPRFCMLMRKHLEGGFIEEITQVGYDRILKFQIRSRNEIGDTALRSLYIEIMGKHSNIVVTDSSTNEILDCIKILSPSQNRLRTLMPGFQYETPANQTKVSPDNIDELDTSNLEGFDEELASFIVKSVQGVSPLFAKEVVAIAHEKNITWQEAFKDYQITISKGEFSPEIVKTDKKLHFYLYPLRSVLGERKSFETISMMLDSFYTEKAESDRVKELTSNLDKFLKREYEKNKKKLEKLYQSLDDADKADKYRIAGELIQIHMGQIKKGQAEAVVQNYYDENNAMITITLDQRKNANENAQSYFHKYSKLKKSVEFVNEQITQTKAECHYLEGILHQLDNATVREAEEIKQELTEEGYIRVRATNKKQRKKKNQKIEVSYYKTTDGTDVLVGKNNLQNEYVTMKLGQRHHFWFHTKDIPGSHVVLCTDNPSETDIREAAMIAAYFSKSKHSSSVPVDYTQIKNIKKPNGSKPGFVIYDNQKTIYIDPEEEITEKLKVK